ncbi:MAG TPA: acyl-CoA dehydrogenase family protein [Kineosporiaceae bacterium]|nr:acyl-CoA dehydrogenase family protein [Kineosporiaceae bacterium]
MPLPGPAFFDDDHEAFRTAVRAFTEAEIAPHLDRWDADRQVDPNLWARAAGQGLIGLSGPAEHGGAEAGDYRFRCVVMEELARVGAAAVNAGVALLDDLVGPYLFDLSTPEQAARWLPGLLSGRTTAAIAMTEPAAGSDLRGIRTTLHPGPDADGLLLSGTKTFITNAPHADLVVVFARDGDAFSLAVVEAGLPGFDRGRPLDTLGQRAEAVGELFFDAVPVPTANLLGVRGRGLAHLMERLPTERLSIAYYALAAAEQALVWTLDHVRSRTAFGTPVAQFQNTKFVLADLSTRIDVTRAYLERCVLALNASALTPVEAAKAKWWATELLQEVTSRCLQLFGGYGYIREYPIARLFVDARVHTIYGGTTEIMKEIVGRDLVGRP